MPAKTAVAATLAGVLSLLTTAPVGAQTIQRDTTYFDFQVTTQASLIPNQPTPHYPDSLRRAHVSGRVLVQYVVDTTGLAVMSTFKVLKATDPAFADAVQTTLPFMRFAPATIGGHRVKQLVQEPFDFAIGAKR